MRKLLMSIVALGLGASPAYAATFIDSAPGPDTAIPAGMLTIDFNNASTLSDIQGLSGNGQIVQGSVVGQYAQPHGGNTRYLSVPQDGSGGVVTLDLSNYDFEAAVGRFSFYWGSIDLYNSLRINTSLGSMNFAFHGDDGGPPANGDQASPANNRRVYFELADGEALQSIEFISPNIAFEIDDIVFEAASPVPEQASWAMMIGGFGMIGGSLRSARREGKMQLQVA